MARSNPGMTTDVGKTVIVIIDSHNDFLGSHGVAWGVVGESMCVSPLT